MQLQLCCTRKPKSQQSTLTSTARFLVSQLRPLPVSLGAQPGLQHAWELLLPSLHLLWPSKPVVLGRRWSRDRDPNWGKAVLVLNYLLLFPSPLLVLQAGAEKHS